MKKQYVNGKNYYRLCPCPTYDFSKMEQWLSDLAEEGLFLSKDGFFGSFAILEYQEKSPAKYRLEAVQKKPGFLEDNGEPDDEQIELGSKYSWEYVAKRGEFYIYRSFDAEARELNTDPMVQAIALNAVKKKQRDTLIAAILMVVVYPIVLTRGCFLTAALSMGTWWMLLTLLFAALVLAEDIRAFVHLKKVQKSLQNEGFYGSEADWGEADPPEAALIFEKRDGEKQKIEKVPYLVRKAVLTVLGIFLLCTLFRAWGLSILKENKIPLEEYDGTIPFATIKDLAGDGASNYKLTMQGLFRGVNTVEERTDVLAPRYMEYNEHAEVWTADGKRIDGGWYVDYAKMRSPALAKILAKEFYRYDKMKKGIEPLEAPELEADYVAAYRNDLHFPTVIIQKGSIVIRAYYFQTGSEEKVPLEEWAGILCDSLQ